MSDIMREVDEAMRQERMEKFWKENGQTLIIFVVATILMTGIISGYRSWDHSVKSKQTGEMMALMEAKDFPDNIKDKKLDFRPGLRGITLINGAQKYLSEKKNDEAMALYAKAADDKGIPEEIRHLAVLQEIRLSKEPTEAQIKKLQAVADDGSSPWRFYAKLEAAAYAAAKNDYKTARKYVAEVMDAKDLPDTLYGKARALDHVYALKSPQEAKAAPTDTTSKTGS